MRLGRNIRGLQIPFKDEVEFSIENNFDIIQLWYQRGKISMLYEKDNIKSLKKCKIPVIFHGAFDINDFDEFEDDFIKLLLNLKHNGVIIISIANGFLNSKENSIISGLIVPGLEFIDIYRGIDMIRELSKEFFNNNFKNINIYTTKEEIYLTAIINKK